GSGHVVDLGGATVLPGFHDAHNHMIGFGMSLAEVELSTPPVGSLDELYEAVARRAGTTAPGEWVIGGGYDQNKLGGHPRPAELAAYAAAREQGRLGVRVELMAASEVLHPLGAHPDDNLVAGLDLGISTGFGDDWLRLGAVKIFADGSLVGRTAALIDDYAA